jgi:hypothetical protein
MAITNKDIEKMKEVFATKQDLEKFATKHDLSEVKAEVMSGFDKVMGELEKAREDRFFAKAKDDSQDKRLEVVEARLAVVESSAGR